MTAASWAGTPAFWAGAAALAGIVVWMLLPSLLGRRASTAVEETGPLGVNIAVLRQQRTQLDADLAAGTLSAEQHRAALEDIERRVLEEEGQSAGPAAVTATASGSSKRTAWVLGLAVPLLAAGLYLKLGQPQAITFVAPQAAVTTSGGEQVTQEQVEQMVTQLAERMKERPDDLQGWTMLARSYGALQRYDDASRAYARAIVLAPKDAQLLADQADTLAMAQGGTALGEPTKLIERALQVDPNNLKALALAGTAAFERSDHAAAVRYWTRASELVPAGSELALGLADGLKEARAKLGSDGSPPSPVAAAPAAQPAAPATVATPSASSALAQVSGRASLAPAIAAKVAPTDTVFIVARAASGPRMPLAVLRRQVSDLPITFTLDDSMAMAPEMKLSAFPKVVVIARISKTGSATPSPDDLVVQSSPVDIGQKDIELVIERPAP